MNALFADTSYFIALLDSDDDFHGAAQALSRRDRRPLLTTSANMLELGARYRWATEHRIFLTILQTLDRGGSEILHVSAPLQQRGIERFGSRPDKDWSLADCISFLVMEDLGLWEAATSDRHFTEAGFVALLRDSQ